MRSTLILRVMIGELILYGVSYQLILYPLSDGMWAQFKWDPCPIQWWMGYELAQFSHIISLPNISLILIMPILLVINKRWKILLTPKKENYEKQNPFYFLLFVSFFIHFPYCQMLRWSIQGKVSVVYYKFKTK